MDEHSAPADFSSLVEVEGAIRTFRQRVNEAASLHATASHRPVACGSSQWVGDTPQLAPASPLQGGVSELLRELAELSAHNAELLFDIQQLEKQYVEARLEHEESRSSTYTDPVAEASHDAGDEQVRLESVFAALAEADEMVDDWVVGGQSTSTETGCRSYRNSQYSVRAPTSATGVGHTGEDQTQTALAAACRRLLDAVSESRESMRSVGTQTDPSVPLFSPKYDVTAEMLRAMEMSTFSIEYMRQILRSMSAQDVSRLTQSEPTFCAFVAAHAGIADLARGQLPALLRGVVGAFPCCVLQDSHWDCGWLLHSLRLGILVTNSNGNTVWRCSITTPLHVTLGQSHDSFQALLTTAQLEKPVPSPESAPVPPVRLLCDILRGRIDGDELQQQYHRSLTLGSASYQMPDGATGTTGISRLGSESGRGVSWVSVILDNDDDISRLRTQLWLRTSHKRFLPFSPNFRVRDRIPPQELLALQGRTPANREPIAYGEPYFLSDDDYFTALNVLSATEVALLRKLHLHPRTYLEAAMMLIGDPSRTWFSLGDIAALLLCVGSSELPLAKADEVADFMEREGYAERVDIVERLP